MRNLPKAGFGAAIALFLAWEGGQRNSRVRRAIDTLARR